MTTSITVLLVFVNNCFNLALLEVCFTEVIIAANVFQFKFVKWFVAQFSLLGSCRPIVSDVFVIMTLVLKSHWLSFILQKAGVLLGYFLGEKNIISWEDLQHLTSETCTVCYCFTNYFAKFSQWFCMFFIFCKKFLVILF